MTSSRPFIRERATGPFFYGKWSRHGQPVIRALGRAWVESDGNSGWRRKRERPPEGALTEAEAAARMLELAREHDAEQTLLKRDAEERRRRGVTFRELAGEYLHWLEDVRSAKPSTLRDHRCVLAEPRQAHRRGSGASRGLVMAALGDRPAPEVITREVEDVLRSIASTGVSPRTVNKARQLVCAIFNYGMRPSTYGLATNPAHHADRRREPDAAPLAFYSPEQVEALAQALADGAHRDPSRPALSPAEVAARTHEDAQDGELIRIAPTRAFVAVSWLRFAGATRTSSAGRSSSVEPSRARRSFARRRHVVPARSRSRIRQRPHSNG